MSQGHELWPSNLLKHFERLLRSAVRFREEDKELGLCSPEELVELEAWSKKMKSLKSSEKQRNGQKVYLVSYCGLLKRKKQRATAYTEEQEIDLVQTGWRQFDQVLFRAASADAKLMSPYVCNPERWVTNRGSTMLTMSDQVPVWLKPAPDVTLVSKERVRNRRQARQNRTSRRKVAEGKHQKEAAEQQPRHVVAAAGNPSNSRCRATLVARQLVDGWTQQGSRQDS